MNHEARKINSFVDLNAWQEGHKLVLQIYGITKKFPAIENFGLISQMQRSAVSITSNIAEGFGRQTFKDKVHFYYIASGSLLELHNQLIIAKDLKYISVEEFNKIGNQLIVTHKIVNGLIKSSKSRIIQNS